jgi:hypothetical protein
MSFNAYYSSLGMHYFTENLTVLLYQRYLTAKSPSPLGCAFKIPDPERLRQAEAGA